MKDGWHKVFSRDVWVKDNKVMRGLSYDRQRTVWPYRWDNKLCCWNECVGISVSAFRAGVNRGTIVLS